MASKFLRRDDGPSADAKRNRTSLVSFVFRPLRSRAAISRYLLHDVGSLSLASKTVYELMVLSLPAISPNISKMPVDRLYIASRPINALTASSWLGLARFNVSYGYPHLLMPFLFADVSPCALSRKLPPSYLESALLSCWARRRSHLRTRCLGLSR